MRRRESDIDDTPIQLRALGFGSDNTLPAIFDLERVEVLRGPQGTLFGAGSEGGTVRYITPAPSLSDFSVYGKTEISTTENGAPNYEGGFAVGGPIVEDTLGFRISAWGRRDGGWIDKVDYMTGATLQSDSNSVNTYVVRGALLWQPTASLSITPSVYYQNRNQNNIDQYWFGLSNPDRGIYKTATPENMADKDHFVLPALKAEWNLGDAELISNTSYFDRRELVQDYSGTLYNLSYFQQSVDYGASIRDFVTPCIGRVVAELSQPRSRSIQILSEPPLLNCKRNRSARVRPTTVSVSTKSKTPYKCNKISPKRSDFNQPIRMHV